jgi:hypothetical protein
LGPLSEKPPIDDNIPSAQLLLVLILPLFFTLLGDTAELYFSPTMAVVAQSIPKMRPRFAGGEECLTGDLNNRLEEV